MSSNALAVESTIIHLAPSTGLSVTTASAPSSIAFAAKLCPSKFSPFSAIKSEPGFIVLVSVEISEISTSAG